MCVSVCLVVVSALCIINVAECLLQNFDENHIGFMQAHHPNRVVEFVYYNSNQSWNEARNTCREIGGDLAMFQDKRDVHIVTNMFSKHNNTIHHNYWIGLCYNLYNIPVWVDVCDVASPLSLENYDIVSNSATNKCFFHEANFFHRGRREKCARQMPFMCQRYLAEECSIDWTNGRTTLFVMSYLTAQQCLEMCKQTKPCTDAVYNFIGKVCTLYNSYYSTLDYGYVAKQCLKVSVNLTLFTSVPDGSFEPNSDCAAGQYVVISATTTTYASESQNTEMLCPCASTVTTDLTTTVHTAITPASSSVYLAPSTQECPNTVPGINITEFEASAIAKQLQKNLTINAKETSAYVRKLTSANDERKSSAVMGWVGIFCVILPVALFLISDCNAIIAQMKRRMCNVNNDQHSNSNQFTIPLEEMHTR